MRTGHPSYGDALSGAVTISPSLPAFHLPSIPVRDDDGG